MEDKEIIEILKNIIDDYGIEIFSDSKKFYSLIMDLTAHKRKEKNILKIAISAGIPKKILELQSLDNSDKNLALSQCTLLLFDDYGLDKKWAKFAVDCFDYALNPEGEIDEDSQNVMLANIIRTMYNS